MPRREDGLSECSELYVHEEETAMGQRAHKGGKGALTLDLVGETHTLDTLYGLQTTGSKKSLKG